MKHATKDPYTVTVIEIGKQVNFTEGLEFTSLTYTVVAKKRDKEGWVKKDVNLLNEITGYAPKGCITAVMGPSGAGKSTFLDGLAGRIASGSLQGRVSLDGKDISASLIKRTSAYIMQDDRLFPMLTVYESLMFAADFRLGPIAWVDKKQRVERMIEQLGLSSSRNTYIGDEGTRGVSGGERRRVSIGVDIIHGPSLLFLDEPTSGLDSTSAYSVIEKVHDIARSGSTVILTIHQPSYRIQMLLDHLIILARGQLMYQGSPKDVTYHIERMGRKIPKGENSIECLIDVIQQYDQSEHGVRAMAEFALTGMKPPPLAAGNISTSLISPTPPQQPHNRRDRQSSRKRLHLQSSDHNDNEFDHSVRTPSRSFTSQSGVMQKLKLTPSRQLNNLKAPLSMSLSPGYYAYSSNILHGTPTPGSSDYTLNEDEYRTPGDVGNTMVYYKHFGPKYANSFFSEIWILMRRNFINIRRTPELFLSRLVVLTVMGFMMATMFTHPKKNPQGITNLLSFFIFTVCLFFFSSNDAVPAFIQERFIFVRETSHNAYRASSYTISGLITYLPFLALQAVVYALIVWFALSLQGSFLYFFIILFMSLMSTNSFVVFISSVVPNYILGYASVIAFTALFFLFCGYFLSSHEIPPYWKWMNKISTMTYPYEGLLMNEFHTNNSFATSTNGHDISGFNILQSLNIALEESKKWQKVYIMLGWSVLYRIFFYIVLRFFSKNQRS
ncbi:hypothetical protein Leryth_006680 [Lithospermum erythrorhizon]|nr:hypothetical protein Leryth_006680 [Lithospermum erythrorhizon]